MIKRAFLVLVSALILGCASKPKDQAGGWCPDKAAYESSKGVNVTLKNANGKVYTIKGEYLWNYYETSIKLINLTKIPTALCISERAGLNASAGKQGNSNVISITIDMLNAIGNDNDALAALIGHELAHLKLNHGAIRAARKQTADKTTSVVGGVLGALIPFGGTITGIGVTAITNTYTRDEERDADKQGLIWAMSLGYSPCGSVRLWKEMMKSDSSGISFLSTHPMSSERLEAASELALKNNFGKCE